MPGRESIRTIRWTEGDGPGGLRTHNGSKPCFLAKFDRPEWLDSTCSNLSRPVPACGEHSPEACDRYYKAFKKMRKLHEDGLAPEVIATELEMSKRLVIQYVVIINRLKKQQDEAAKAQGTKEVAA
ncbi:MAG TPA: DUF1670 domain-containing protein [Thermoplasmata archaeon]|nr:DUF1670 domain-containing protein [Thermoplasmata archaeon]